MQLLKSVHSKARRSMFCTIGPDPVQLVQPIRLLCVFLHHQFSSLYSFQNQCLSSESPVIVHLTMGSTLSRNKPQSAKGRRVLGKATISQTCRKYSGIIKNWLSPQARFTLRLCYSAFTDNTAALFYGIETSSRILRENISFNMSKQGEACEQKDRYYSLLNDHIWGR